MSKFVPSTFQNDIFEFIQHGTGNAVISAVAGSGKTTTLIHALTLIPTDKSILFLAFNKSIATELQARGMNGDGAAKITRHYYSL